MDVNRELLLNFLPTQNETCAFDFSRELILTLFTKISYIQINPFNYAYEYDHVHKNNLTTCSKIKDIKRLIIVGER